VSYLKNAKLNLAELCHVPEEEPTVIVPIGRFHCLWALHKRRTSSDPTDENPMESGPMTSVVMLLVHRIKSIAKGTVFCDDLGRDWRSVLGLRRA
jgi:hypothetical protein